MKSLSAIKLVSFIVFTPFLFFSCQLPSKYELSIQKERDQKNSEFKLIETSPLDSEKISDFDGLNYFDVDSTFRTIAIFEKNEKPDSIVMATSTGEPRKGFKIGKAEFSIGEKELSLSVYLLQTRKGLLDSTYYFIPFTDETSGKESYVAGRYIDIHGPLNDNDTFSLDFNSAYNPYCNYSHRYSCPIPPKENHLNFEIKAGEKMFHIN